MQIGKPRRSTASFGKRKVRSPDGVQRSRDSARRAGQVPYRLELSEAASRERGANGGIKVLGSGGAQEPASETACHLRQRQDLAPIAPARAAAARCMRKASGPSTMSVEC
jgi:hypothetical protein